MKKDNGVTLVALVVTIIVLIILAGVTIVKVVSDEGVIEKANEAKEETEIAQDEEEEDLKDVYDYIVDEEEFIENPTGNATDDTPQYSDITGNDVTDEDMVFYINNTECTAKKGMTWYDFINAYDGSDHYTINVGSDNYYISQNGETMSEDDGWIGRNDNYMVYDEEGNHVYASYLIEEGHKYTQSTVGGEK